MKVLLLQLRKYKLDIFSLLILIAVYLLYFRLYLFFNIGIIGEDNDVQFYPRFQFVIECFKKGEFPFWDSYTQLGFPYYSSIVTSLFNPFFLIYFFVCSFGTQTYLSFQVLELMGYFTGLILTYAGFRMIRISWVGAVFGSVIYIFCGRHVMIKDCVNQVYAAGFIPILFAIFYRFMEIRSWRNVLLCSFVLGIFLSLGDGNYIVFGLSIIMISLIFKLFVGNDERSYPFNRIEYLFKLLIIFFLAFGITAIWLLPNLQFMAYSTRTALSEAWLSLNLWQIYRLLNIIFPVYFYPNYFPYMGILPIFLIIIYFFIVRKKSSYVYLYIIFIILGFLLSTNELNALWDILKTFPLFRSLRFANHSLVLYNLAVSFLCSYAVEHFYKSENDIGIEQKKRFFLIFGIFMILLFAAFWTPVAIYYTGNQSSRLNIVYSYEAFTLLSVLSIATIFGISISVCRKKKTIFICLMLLILLADLFHHRPTHYRHNTNKIAVKKPQTEGWFASEEFRAIKEDTSLFRVEGFSRDLKFPYYLNFSSIGGYTPDGTTLYSYKRFIAGEHDLNNKYYDFFSEPHPHFAADSKLYDFLNVKYFYVQGYNKPFFSELTVEDLIKKGELVKIEENLYLNENYLPRAFFTNTYFMNKEEKFIYHKSKIFDPKKPLLRERPSFVSSKCNLYAEPSVIEYGNNVVKIEIDAPDEGLIVLSDVLYPGWSAYVDGNKTKIYQANYLFRAIEIPKGKHSVQFIFSPKVFKYGVVISLLTSLIMIFLFFYTKKGRYEYKKRHI